MAMAMAVRTRALIGRASAKAAISSSSSSTSITPAHLSLAYPPLCHHSTPLSVKSSSSASATTILQQLRLSPSPRPSPLPRCISTSVSQPETSSPSSPSSPPTTETAAPEIDVLDIRVGRVLKAWKHPEADSLYVEEVDLAEPSGPRTICSGLVNYLSVEELEGRAVLVFANLKARNMRGVKSNGMLLAASNAEHTKVELLSPPEGAEPGERVWFGAEREREGQAAAGSPNQVQKKKIWESVQPLLRTSEERVAMFEGRPMRVSSGVVTCQSLPGANIS